MNNQPITLSKTIVSDLIEIWEDNAFPSERFASGPYTNETGFNNLSEIEEYLDLLPTTDAAILDVLKQYFGDRLSFQSQGVGGYGNFYLWDGTVHRNERHIQFDDSQDVGYELAMALSEFYRRLFNFMKDTAFPILAEYQDSGEHKGAKEKLATYLRKEVLGIKKLSDTFQDGGYIGKFSNVLQKKFKVNPDHFAPENCKEIVFSDGRYLTREDLANAETVDDLLPMLREPLPALRSLRKANLTLTEDYEDKGLWKAFLDRTVVKKDTAGTYTPNELDQSTLQWLYGAGILGNGEVKYLINITGPRNSGKGSIVSMFSKIYGSNGEDTIPGYAPEVPSESIEIGNKFDRGAYGGARLPFLQEPTEKKIDGPFLKKYAGGTSTSVSSEEKFKDKTKWKPMGLLTVVSNHPLKIDSTDQPLRRRILPFDFPRSVLPGDPEFDTQFEEKIIDQDGESILRWILQGAIDFLKNGEQIPQEILDRQDERFAQSSVAVEWISTMLDHSNEPTQYFRMKKAPKGRCLTSGTSTYEKFTLWATMEGYAPKEIPGITVWRNEVGAYLGMTEDEIKRKQTRKTRFYGVVDILEEPELSYVSEEAQQYVNSFAPTN